MINGLRNLSTGNFKVMRRILSVLALGLMTQAVFGQVKSEQEKMDSTQCWEKYNNAGSLYNQAIHVQRSMANYKEVKADLFAQAYEPWSFVFTTCPDFNKNLYIMGPTILDAMIDAEKAAGNNAKMQEYVDVLLQQYDKRLEIFPGKEAYVTAAKAQALYEHRLDSEMSKVFQLYQDAIAIDPKEMTATQIQGFFFCAVRLFNEDSISLSQLFDIHNQIDESVQANTNELNVELAGLRMQRDSSLLDSRGARQLQRDSIYLRNYLAVKNNIDIKLRPILSSCEKISLVYNSESYEANKDNETWIRRAVRTLGAEYTNDSGEVVSCRENPLYFELAERLYQMNPSTEAARNMGRLAMSKKEYAKAKDYFTEAIATEADPIVKAEDWLKIALCDQKLNRLADAKSDIMNSIALNKTGQAYLQLSVVYASAGGLCGNDAIEKNAVFWAAINKANYAATLDPSLQKAVNRAVASYKNSVPTKRVGFDLGRTEGETVKIGCWINETVTIQFFK